MRMAAVPIPLVYLSLLTAASTPAQVVVNEFMADNATTLEDPDEPGAFEDWIELYNAGSTLADLSGMHLTDDLAERERWPLPDGSSLEAGAHLLIWADDDAAQGPLHTNFKLAKDGEIIGLFDADGALIDSVAFGPQTTDFSLGRYPDGGPGWRVMNSPSPGAPNSVPMASTPRFSVDGGTFTGRLEVVLSAIGATPALYYTTDGSEPTPNTGIRYEAPLSLESSTWLRARVYEEGLAPGPVASRTYLAIAPSVASFQSNLPLVIFDTFGFDIDQSGGPEDAETFYPVMSVFIDTTQGLDGASILGPINHAGYAGMRVRGQSTRDYAKKQYALELWDESRQDRDAEILGMPTEADWIIHAPFSDKTLMRNHLIYGWSHDIGRYAVRTRFAEAFIDREGDGLIGAEDYAGVYVIMEKIERDKNRVDVAKLEPEEVEEPDVSGGYILRKDWWFFERPRYYFRTATYRDVLLHVYPDGDRIASAQRTWIEGHFDRFEGVLQSDGFSHPLLGYSSFIDVGSFIDHHLLVEMARNVDGFVLSTYLFKDREDSIHMGPIWDYNGSLGNADYFCSFEPSGWHHQFDERECGGGGETFPADNPNAYKWYERLFEDPDFAVAYADRWAELRSGPLATDKLLADIESTVTLLTHGGAAESPVNRNFQRWDILDEYVWPNYYWGGDYDDQVAWLRTWLTGRLDWMDGAVLDYYGGPCNLQVQLNHAPATVARGETLAFDASVVNPCSSQRVFDRAVLQIRGPASMTQTLYDGSDISLGSGKKVESPIRLMVPNRAPLGTYVVQIDLYRDGEVLNTGAFQVQVL